MSFDLNNWLKETINVVAIVPGHYHQEVRPRILCNDGYSVSVQASAHTYCKPRYTQWPDEDGWNVTNGNYWMSGETPRHFKTDHFTPYESVELGFPSEEDELIYDYSEGDDYIGTVYAQVPVKIVEQLIEKHGGFKEVDESNVKGELNEH